MREWIRAATSSGRGIVPINMETLGCAFEGLVDELNIMRKYLQSCMVDANIQEFQSRDNALC